jgi:hypothetical protein
VGCIVGDARALHSDPELQGALFQVASQFNLLEMTSPSVRPEDGVARYAGDPTQGPAGAIAAGAATIYRNYCVPVGNQTGQTGDHQLDALATMGDVLAAELARPVTDLWTIRNGYALCTEPGLDAIAGLLEQAPDEQRDTLRGALRIGLHRDVEVTDVREGRRRLVSQAFCSALPINYSHTPHANRVRSPGQSWRPPTKPPRWRLRSKPRQE